MNKLLFLLIASFFFFVSCSSDDSNNLVLLRKCIEPSDWAGQADIETNFIYTQNKIVSINSGSYKTVFTYVGDLITRMDYYNADKLYSTINYKYLNGKLVSDFVDNLRLLSNDFIVEYVYNVDGTISFAEYKIYTDGSKGKFAENEGKILLSNGNFVEMSLQYGNATPTILKFQYDANLSPFINVLGFKAIFLSHLTRSASNLFTQPISENNVIRRNENSGFYTGEITAEFIYDKNGFPSTKKRFIDGKFVGVSQYFYE